MESKTKIRDLIALNFWVNKNSKLNGVVLLLGGMYLTFYLFHKKLKFENVLVDMITLVAGFGASIFLIIVCSLPFVLVLIMMNIFIKGTLGESYFTLTKDEFIEKDKYKEIHVAWDAVRRIDFTSNHIFVQISRFKYFAIPKRNFDNEYEFIKYFSEISRLRHEYNLQMKVD